MYQLYLSMEVYSKSLILLSFQEFLRNSLISPLCKPMQLHSEAYIRQSNLGTKSEINIKIRHVSVCLTILFRTDKVSVSNLSPLIGLSNII